MGLDIEFRENQKKLCPHCGELVEMETVSCEDSGGQGWYPILESIGYYVPYELRTEENNWYGKDMTLNPEQLRKVYDYIKKHHSDLYCATEIMGLIARAILEGNEVVINADW